MAECSIAAHAANEKACVCGARRYAPAIVCDQASYHMQAVTGGTHLAQHQRFRHVGWLLAHAHQGWLMFVTATVHPDQHITGDCTSTQSQISGSFIWSHRASTPALVFSRHNAQKEGTDASHINAARTPHFHRYVKCPRQRMTTRRPVDASTPHRTRAIIPVKRMS